jgi:hypothetical protein
MATAIRVIAVSACVFLLAQDVRSALGSDGPFCGFDQKQEVTAPGVGGYGYSVALSADHAVVGAETEVVHIFCRSDPGTPANLADDQWVHQAELRSADEPVYYQGFGRAVALAGDWLLVGAPYDDDLCTNDIQCNSGAAFLFLRDDHGTPSEPGDDTWIRKARLLPPDRAEDDYFGVSVSLQADEAVIGADLNDDACVNDRYCDSGSVYVFRRHDAGTPGDPRDDTWYFSSKLTAGDAAKYDNFGWRVELDGDRMAVSAWHESDGGAVYVFRRSGSGNSWIEQTKIDAPAEYESWYFGFAIALRGEYLAIGAIDTWINNRQSVGDAYVYHLHDAGTPSDATDDSWVRQARLTAPVPQGHDYFGWAVTINENQVVVGSPGDDGACTPYYCDYGSVHHFARNDGGTPDDKTDDSWVFAQELSAREPPTSAARFGVAAAMVEGRILVGARNGTSTPVTGQAYLFTGDVDCNGNGASDACDVSKRTSADCNLNNIPDECDVTEGRALDCNGNLAIDLCEVAGEMTPDCNNNYVPDECDLADPLRFDCNGNTTIDRCEVTPGSPNDCNWNYRPDECELADGAQLDCDMNGLLDVCDIYSDAALDCNDNGLLDQCTELEPDCNANSRPDDCERAALLQRFESPPTTSVSAYYGVLAATDAAHLVVGNPRENGTEDELGAVRVYRLAADSSPLDPGDNHWTYVTTLAPNDAGANGGFGEAVDIDGRVIVVGAMRADGPAIPDVGVVYVFEQGDNGTPENSADDSWTEKAKLIASDAGYRDAFGSAVAVHRQLIVVGAPGDGDPGWVYVFRRSSSKSNGPGSGNWVEVAKIDGTIADQQFGGAVDVTDDTLVVAAPNEPNPSYRGAVYVYSSSVEGPPGEGGPSVWIERARLTPPDPIPGNRSGVSVSMSGRRLVVGEQGYDGVFAHIFQRVDSGTPDDAADDVWTHEAALPAIEQFAETRLSVSADGDRLILGGFSTNYAYYYDGFALVYRVADQGTPFLLQDDIWRLETELLGGAPEERPYFGAAVALRDGNVVVRAGRSDYSDVPAERITSYAYGLTNDDCNANLVPDDCDLSDATSLDENRNAIPDECERSAVFFACLAGPEDPPGTFWNRNSIDCRRAFDGNADGFVDLRDVSHFTRRFGD